jgi:hypothetical protein
MVSNAMWKGIEHSIPGDPRGDLGKKAESMGARTFKLHSTHQLREEGMVSVI